MFKEPEKYTTNQLAKRELRNNKDDRKKCIVVTTVVYVLKWNDMTEPGITVLIHEMLTKEQKS